MATRVGFPMITLLLVLGAGLLVLMTSGPATAAVAPAAKSATIAPAGLGAALHPGGTSTFTVTVTNEESGPVRVVSIGAGRSTATSRGCPAGVITSAPLSNPGGTIAAGGSVTYTLTASMADDPSEACQGQRFSLPLTARLVAAN